MKLISITSGTKLISNPYFDAAKNGNYNASIKLVWDVFRDKEDKIVNFIESLPPNSYMAPIHALEKGGYNAIANAMVWMITDHPLAKAKNITQYDDVYQMNKVHHTNATAMARLLSKPLFMGPVEPGKQYCILDDVVTSGSTVNECRNYIQENKGIVHSALTLAASFNPQAGYSGVVDISPDTEQKILSKFDEPKLNKLLSQYGITENWRKLSNSQANYLTTFSTVVGIRNKISETVNQRRKKTVQRVYAR
jgi:hypoxanthine phosphoribosyltransferase